MAYFDENDENDTGVSPSQQATSGESAFVSGSSVGTDGGEQGQAANSAPGAPDNPGNFVGIKDYITANKPQSQKLASQVGQGVTDLGNQARAATGQAETQFNQDVDQNTVKADDNLVNQVKSSANTLSAEQRAQVNRDKAAQYKGPADLTSSQFYQPAAASVQKAQQQADLTKTEAGQREILKPMEQKAKHGTNQGINTFDSMLLQAAPNARGELEAARQSVADIPDAFQQTLSNAFNKASGAQQTTAAAAKAYQDAITQGVEGNQIDDAYKAWSDDVTGKNAAFRAANSGMKIDPASLAQFGLTAGDTLYDVDLGNFINQAGPTSMEQFADPEAWAKYEALKELGGQFDYTLDDTRKADAGTRGSGLDTGNIEGLKQAIAGRKNAFESEQSSLQSQTQAAQQRVAELQAVLNSTGGPNNPSNTYVFDGGNTAPGADPNVAAQINAYNALIQQYQAALGALPSKYQTNRKA